MMLWTSDCGRRVEFRRWMSDCQDMDFRMLASGCRSGCGGGREAVDIRLWTPIDATLRTDTDSWKSAAARLGSGEGKRLHALWRRGKDQLPERRKLPTADVGKRRTLRPVGRADVFRKLVTRHLVLTRHLRGRQGLTLSMNTRPSQE